MEGRLKFRSWKRSCKNVWFGYSTEQEVRLRGSSLEDGCEAYFDLSSLKRIDIRSLSVGKVVEYQELFGHERLRAVRVTVIQNLQSESASKS